MGIKGRSGIHAYVDTYTQAPTMWRKHMTNNPKIKIDGDKASAETYFQRLDEDQRGAYIMAFGRYATGQGGRRKMASCQARVADGKSHARFLATMVKCCNRRSLELFELVNKSGASVIGEVKTISKKEQIKCGKKWEWWSNILESLRPAEKNRGGLRWSE